MKETFVGVGLLLLFAGILVLPMSLQFAKTEASNLVVEREFLVFPDWTISAQFNASEELIVYFSRPSGENIPEPSGERYMYVNITDPQGGTAAFDVVFTRTSFEVSLNQTSSGLLVDLPSVPGPADIGGRTQYSGEYTATVYTYPGLVGYYYPNSSTMRRLQLLEVTEQVDYPHIWALPVAVTLIAVGCVSLVWGTRSPKHRVKSRKTHRK